MQTLIFSEPLKIGYETHADKIFRKLHIARLLDK